MGSWLESVPNVSLGRDARAVRGLGRGLGDTLLDIHQDPDHDRSVFTLVGPRGELEETLMVLASRALRRIDLREADGVHPRVGALDVVPFVPLGRTSMAAAVRAARAFARRFSRQFHVPVFLYGEAARAGRPRELPDLRRGGLGGLTQRMRDGLAPDHGPTHPHPRHGVTLVGARPVLVAFNVDMPEDALPATRRLARRLRESSGGLPALRALGLELASRGRSQLSMNFLDHDTTCPSEVLERLRAEGAPIVRSEVVGLLPEAVLARAARAHLGLDEDFDEDLHVLERRLRLEDARKALADLAPRLGPELHREVRRALARALDTPERRLRAPKSAVQERPARGAKSPSDPGGAV